MSILILTVPTCRDFVKSRVVGLGVRLLVLETTGVNPKPSWN